MNFSEKLQILRKSKGLTQEALAEKINVSRQAVAKWEAGQAYPDISNLIQISDLMSVTVDYLGRVLDERFSGNFLKEALRAADQKMPYRGPEFYQSGEYSYKCSVNGDFSWFQGYEEIFCNDIKVYECYFHGGIVS